MENESLLQRLQEANSTYNVYDWDNERKEAVKRVKNICYYEPTCKMSMQKKKYKRRAASTRRGGAPSGRNEPNK